MRRPTQHSPSCLWHVHLPSRCRATRPSHTTRSAHTCPAPLTQASCRSRQPCVALRCLLCVASRGWMAATKTACPTCCVDPEPSPGTFDCPLGPWPSPSPPLPLPTLCCRAAEGGGCRPAPPHPRRQCRAARCWRELSITPLSPHERPAIPCCCTSRCVAGQETAGDAIPATQQAQCQPASRLQKQHGWLVWLVRMNHPFLLKVPFVCVDEPDKIALQPEQPHAAFHV